MTNLAAIIPHAAVDLKGRTVVIELICADEYGARILYEDVVSLITSGQGLKLKIKGEVARSGVPT